MQVSKKQTLSQQTFLLATEAISVMEIHKLVPLAKLSPDDPTTVEVFECCINGQEILPGYTGQNDPIAQRTTSEV